MTSENSNSPLPPVIFQAVEDDGKPTPFQVALKKARATTPEALAIKEAIRTDPNLIDFKAEIRAAKKATKDAPLSAKTALVVKRTLTEHNQSLAIVCPVSGLVVPSGLPPFLGMVLDCYHPMVFNALAILDLPNYCESLTSEHKAALFLASMHALGKIELVDSALVVVKALETTLEAGQLLILLNFVDTAVRRTTRHYPKLTLDRNVSETKLLAYMTLCVEVENYAGDAAWFAAETNAKKHEPVVKAAPAFLSSINQGKRLDKACYEAWLEAAQHIPKATVLKAAPFCKILASCQDSRTIGRLVDAVMNYCLDQAGELGGEEAAVAAVDFKEAVEANRKTASNLGLHRDELTLDLGLEPLEPLESLEPLEAEAHVEEKEEAKEAKEEPKEAAQSSFALRLAAYKAKHGV